MKILRITASAFCLSVITASADANSDAEKKLATIANPPLVITTDTAAGSPSVTVTDKGVWINKAQVPVPFDQVLIGLAALPKKAWPCGRVVYYSTSPADPAQGGAVSKEVAEKIELELQAHNFRLVR